ncbi:MAG: MBL fold metallo-hydrolase [Elusimicrobiota bacterium]|nr:MBL fold metallo-hydrolase [Elusimicrobiota bacterium]
MKIKFWGARGSITVCGKDYLKYGGDTTCVEIRSKKGDLIIIDAGTGIRNLGKQLIKEGTKSFNMLFTHSHWDHIMGFPFFAPIYRKSTKIVLRGCSFCAESIKEVLTKTMRPPGFPVKFEEISASFEYRSVPAEKFEIGGIKITPIELSHPNFGLGYRFEEDEKSFVFLTDNELGFSHPGAKKFEDYVAFCAGADLLVHDAEYTEEEYPKKKTWGHSTNKQALNLALKAKVKTLGFTHHNQDRIDIEVDKMVDSCKADSKAEGIDLDCFAVQVGQEIEL